MPRVCFGRAPGTRNELQSSPGAVSALPKPAAQRACEKQNANSATVSGTEGARSYAAAPRRSLQIKHAERKAHAPGLCFFPRTTQAGRTPPQNDHLHLTRLLRFLIDCRDDAVGDLLCRRAAGGSAAAAAPRAHRGNGGVVWYTGLAERRGQQPSAQVAPVWCWEAHTSHSWPRCWRHNKQEQKHRVLLIHCWGER